MSMNLQKHTFAFFVLNVNRYKHNGNVHELTKVLVTAKDQETARKRLEMCGCKRINYIGNRDYECSL